MTTCDTILARDQRHAWHPYATTLHPAATHQVLEANGTRLVLKGADGQRTEVVDAMASWWCQVHGYRNPHLDAAAHRQIDRFSHVMFGGLTHEPAITLIEQLVECAPAGRERVFLADSGSVAMEVAIKLARQWQVARGRRTRQRLAALRGGYHGDTWGAMALCDPQGGMHSMYAGAVQSHVFLPRPPAFEADDAAVAEWAVTARELVVEHRDELAAVVVEPILQGAGGMWPWAPAALGALRELCDEFDILLVADEIATGLGRTGRLFACEWANVVPDVLVLGKALTGGYLTQAAVLTTQAIAEAISRECGALMHGPTFMANPLACAVSSASLELIGGPQGPWRGHVARLQHVLDTELTPLRSHAGVADVRLLGGAAAVELKAPVDLALATRVAVANGVWLRPFGNLVYAMPPYTCTTDDLQRIGGGMRAVVDALTTAGNGSHR